MRSSDIKTSAKSALLRPALFFNSSFAYTSKMSLACARGTLSVATRTLDPASPHTWEFCAFSQNGEDGIVDHLLSHVAQPNRYFIEIGASDGLENNSSYLAFVKKYSGVMVEGNSFKSENAKRFLQQMNWSVEYLNLFIEPGNASTLLALSAYMDPDFFSIDIDSNDFYVASALFEGGLRPKVVCVEYNSTFGPEMSVSIPYTPNLDYTTFHPSQLYYGVSVMGWRTMLESQGYRFVTVDTRGVNAFFVDPNAVDLQGDIKGTDFAENQAQYVRQKAGWETQLAKIAALPLERI